MLDTFLMPMMVAHLNIISRVDPGGFLAKMSLDILGFQGLPSIAYFLVLLLDSYVNGMPQQRSQRRPENNVA
jgi:hypothetical protein